MCDAVVIAVAKVDGGRKVRVRIAPRHRERLDYVVGVPTDARPPVVRRHPRVRYHAPIHVEIEGASIRSVTGDISCGGAFIVCDQPPPIGTEVRVALEIEGDRKIQTDARVTWIGEAARKHGFGVQFSLDRAAMARVRDIVRARAE